MEDWRLIQEYGERGSEAAFTALVDRHLPLVYSTALRRLGDPGTAEEVSQSVFCLLAQKARQLRSDTALVSWLYRATCFITARYQRAEKRRRQREEEAARMQKAEPTQGDVWEQMLPYLDEAIAQLSEPDRLAILLRFFQRKPLKDIGMVLGIGEDAARMRVNRALDKLHSSLASRGLGCSAAILAAGLGGNCVQAVPLRTARLVRKAALETAKAASVPSLLTSIFILFAKAKASTLTLGGLALLALAVTAVNWSSRTPSPAISSADLQVSGMEGTVREIGNSTRQRRFVAQVEAPAPVFSAPEPTYGGKTVSEWFAEYERSEPYHIYDNAPGDSNSTVEAFRQLAPRSITYLVQALRATEADLNTRFPGTNVSHVHAKARRALDALGPAAKSAIPELLTLLWDPNSTIRKEIPSMLHLMGPEAAPAVPALAAALQDPELRESVSLAFTTIGPAAAPAVPDMIEALKDPSSVVRGNLANALAEIGSEAEAAVPTLLGLLQDTRSLVRRNAANAVVAIQPQLAPQVIPTLIELLGDPDAPNRYLSADTLGRIGSSAKNAIPALIAVIQPEELRRLQKSHQETYSLEVSVRQALRKIDPRSEELLARMSTSSASQDTDP